MITNVKPFKVRLVAMPSADRGKYTIDKVYTVRCVWEGEDEEGRGLLDFLVADDNGNFGWVNAAKFKEERWTFLGLFSR